MIPVVKCATPHQARRVHARGRVVTSVGGAMGDELATIAQVGEHDE